MEAPWTSIPNDVIANLPLFTEAEMRVILVIARHTIGWQKKRDRISLTQFQKETGMSRQGAINGVSGLLSKGWIRSWEVAGGRDYEIVVDEQERRLLVHEVDQQKQAASQPSRPEVVNVVDRTSQPSRPKVVNVVDTQKKGKKKERKEKKVQPAKPAAPNYGKYFVEIGEACGMDVSVGMFAKRVSVAAKFLSSREGDDLVHGFVNWWKTQDWRGKKGDIPKPENFVNEWPQFSNQARVPGGRQARPVLEDEIAMAEAEARRMLGG